VQPLTDKQANEILANALASQERNEPTPTKVQSPIEENADAELEQEQEQQHPFDTSLSPIPAPTSGEVVSGKFLNNSSEYFQLIKSFF